MGRQIDKSNIGYLDLDFQYKLAKIFVEDSKFFEDVASIVDQNAFTDSLLRKFVGTLKDYYTKESVIPSYEMLNIILREKAKTTNDIEEVNELIKKIKFETSLEGYIFVKDVALKFFKQQNLIRVANKILEIAGKGDIERYEECQRLLDEAAMATSLYFIFRTIGCFSGTFILRWISSRLSFGVSSAMIVAAMAGLLFADTQVSLYICIALIGFGNSNIFPIIFSQALLGEPEKKNEVSGLMIMGLFGGTIFPLAMGYAADMFGQNGSVAVMAVGAIFLLVYTFMIKKSK